MFSFVGCLFPFASFGGALHAFNSAMRSAGEEISFFPFRTLRSSVFRVLFSDRTFVLARSRDSSSRSAGAGLLPFFRAPGASELLLRAIFLKRQSEVILLSSPWVPSGTAWFSGAMKIVQNSFLF